MFGRTRQMLLLGLSVLMVTVAVTGCTQTGQTKTTAKEGLDDLGAVTVIAREEGSGTREVFAETLGFMDSSTGRDQTTEDAQIAESSQAVIDKVAAGQSAIGYVSEGMLKQTDQKVHAVTVNGKNLERKFYLAYTGKLSDVETDFISYIESAGQEIVGENATPVGKVTDFLSMKPNGTIRIGGSTSVAGLMQKLADAYMELNPNAAIDIVETDSTNGLTGAMSGTYDLGMSSRDLKEYEKQLLEYDVIAKDEIAVIVQADNPLTNIASDDLRRIYTGEIREWNELSISTKDN